MNNLYRRHKFGTAQPKKCINLLKHNHDQNGESDERVSPEMFPELENPFSLDFDQGFEPGRESFPDQGLSPSGEL